MVLQTGYKHIVKDRRDSDPRIDGTRIDVAQIVNELGAEPTQEAIDRLIEAYSPGYLTRENILSALAYFKDHPNEIARTLENGKPPEGFVLDSKGNFSYRVISR